jgi:predicted aldo/keto reductase-like oxidoreductase
MIPACFEVYNKMHMFEEFALTTFSYAVRMSGTLTGGQPGFASQCVQCGECLEKCPQTIPIPDVLEQVVADLEGEGLEERITAGKAMLRGR